MKIYTMHCNFSNWTNEIFYCSLMTTHWLHREKFDKFHFIVSLMTASKSFSDISTQFYLVYFNPLIFFFSFALKHHALQNIWLNHINVSYNRTYSNLMLFPKCLHFNGFRWIAILHWKLLSWRELVHLKELKYFQ